MFNSEELDKALYNATDILQRTMVPFILLKETAKDVMAGPERLTEADGIYIGVEKRHLIPEVISTLNSFGNNVDMHYGMDDFYMNEDRISWLHRGVPVNIKIIKSRYRVFAKLDMKFYRLEEYWLPNPFEEYWRMRNIIR